MSEKLLIPKLFLSFLIVLTLINCNNSNLVKEKKAIIFNGTPIELLVDNGLKSYKLINDSAVFKDKYSRELVIIGIEKTGDNNIIYANMIMKKSQSTTFTLDKCKEGIIKKDLSNIPRSERFSNGTIELTQKGYYIIFTVVDGFVELGVSFDFEYGLTGETESNMEFNYFTKGTKLIAKTAINITL